MGSKNPQKGESLSWSIPTMTVNGSAPPGGVNVKNVHSQIMQIVQWGTHFFRRNMMFLIKAKQLAK